MSSDLNTMVNEDDSDLSTDPRLIQDDFFLVVLLINVFAPNLLKIEMLSRLPSLILLPLLLLILTHPHVSVPCLDQTMRQLLII